MVTRSMAQSVVLGHTVFGNLHIFMVGGNWNELPLALSYVGAGVVPPVLLSGTAFWLLVRRFSQLEANAEL